MKILLQISLSILCISALLWFLGSEELVEKMQMLSLKDFIAILLFCLASLGLLAKRFQFVCSHGGIHNPWKSCFSLQLMGLTMNQFLPGIYGGDLLRAGYFMVQNRWAKRFLTSSVVFERICGLMAMLLIGMVACIALWFSHGVIKWLFFALLFAVMLALFLLVAGSVKRLSEGNIVNRFVKITKNVSEDLTILATDRKLVLIVLLYSLLSQTFSILGYWYLLQLAGVTISFAAVAFVVAVGWLVTLLPMSLNGLGVRETGLVAGFLFFGVSQSTALSVSLLGLLPTFFFAAVGGVLLGVNMKKVAAMRELIRE